VPKQNNNSSFAQSLGLQILQVAFIDGLSTAQNTTQLNVRDRQYGSFEVLVFLRRHSSSLLLPAAVDEGEWIASRPDHFNLQKRVPVPIRLDAEWAPKLWGRMDRKSLCSHNGNPTSLIGSSVRPTYSAVTILTELQNGMAPETA